MLIWVDTAQEMLDTTLLAYRIAEDRRVFLPIAMSADGAFLTHSQTIVQVPTRAKVDRFLPRYDRGDLLLHPDNPITVAPAGQRGLGHRDPAAERRGDEARACTVIEEAYADFRKVFGRGPENPWFEEYMTEDADIILVGMGTISLPMKVGIRNMRAQGKKVGLVRPRWFRPFPTERMVTALSQAPRPSASSTATTPSARPSARAWSPTRSAPRMYNADKRPPLLSLHLRPRRPRGDARGRRQGDRHVLRGRRRPASPQPKTHWLGVRE